MSPEELLFINPDTKVYDSQTQLADEILKRGFLKSIKPESLKSLLSKTLRGERRLSTKLHDAILQVLAQDTNVNEETYLKVESRIKDVFENAYNEKTQLKKFQNKKEISTRLFVDLELHSKDIEVYCVTANLNWAREHIDEILSSAKNNNSSYKYLVFDYKAERNVGFILRKVEEAGVEDRVQIKRVYKKLAYHELNGNNQVETFGVLFPLFEDLVIYRNIPNRYKEVFGIRNSSIVVRGTAIYDDEYDRVIDDFILDEKSRITITTDWFETIWEACEEIKSK